MNKGARYSLELANLPAATAEQVLEIDSVAARPESDMIYSDIPPLAEEFWTNAAVGRFYTPKKTSTSVRLDPDALAWVRAQGKGYQTRIYAILRREMPASMT